MPKTINVTYSNGVKFNVTREGHTLVCDQPVAGGGADAGLSPVELLAASLATCAGYFVAKFLQARKLDCAGLSVDVDFDYADNPRRVGAFRMRMKLPPGVPEKYLDAVKRTIETCTVHNTLHVPPTIETELIF
jgi:putative redox protein